MTHARCRVLMKLLLCALSDIPTSAGDLPVRGFMGQLEERMLPHIHNVFLWTHLHFEFEYNGNQVRPTRCHSSVCPQ